MVVVVVQVIKSLSSGKKVGGDFTCATISPKVHTHIHTQSDDPPTGHQPASQPDHSRQAARRPGGA